MKPYLNEKISRGIAEKGFEVYNYISFGELLDTVRKQYLEILLRINVPFAVITVILGLISFGTEDFRGLLYFLFSVYGCILFYLFFHFIKRSYMFVFIKDILYTDRGIVLGKEILYYQKEYTITEKLQRYEYMFEEYLSKPSRLRDIIVKKQNELLVKTGNNALSGLKKAADLGDLGDSREGAGIMTAITISFFIYVVFLYAFYYLGYFISFLIFYPYSFCLKIYLYFNKNLASEISHQMKKIDTNFEKMSEIYVFISEKITAFEKKDFWQIDTVMKKDLPIFFSYIENVVAEKNTLLELLEYSKYKKFINFHLLKNYLKNKYNAPILDMVHMLQGFQENLVQQLGEVQKTISEQPEFSSHLSHKEVTLKNNIEKIGRNIIVMEGSILK